MRRNHKSSVARRLPTLSNRPGFQGAGDRGPLQDPRKPRRTLKDTGKILREQSRGIDWLRVLRVVLVVLALAGLVWLWLTIQEIAYAD